MLELSKNEYNAFIDSADEIADHACLTIETGVESRQIECIRVERGNKTDYVFNIAAIESDYSGIQEVLEAFGQAIRSNEYEEKFLLADDRYEAAEFIKEQLADATFI